jgi:glycosyltransferase involved in cell wall biosynthesis
MQEIKKRRILLASVLKPMDEPRMFERFGHSLAANGYEVFIAGFPNSATSMPANGTQFLPHKKFNRISIARIKVRFEILQKAFSIKPDVFVISTHELIGIALIYRILTGRKIVYDVQENYWLNITHTHAWPKFIRPIVAFTVRLKEVISSPLFSKFLLAEKCYEKELRFVKGKSTVIENKCRLPDHFQRRPSINCIPLIFTGTLAESTGVFDAIDLTKKLYKTNSRIRLSIIGHCAQSKVLSRIKEEIANSNFISLIGGNDFVPHEKIMEAVATAHFGIIAYRKSPHTENRIPSKLYEYMAGELPILLQNHQPWIEVCEPYTAAVPVDYNQPDIKMILEKISLNNLYTSYPNEANWQNEELVLLRAIHELLP